MPAALLLLLANHHQWQHMKPVRLRCAASDGCVCVHRCELSRQRLVLKPHQYHKFYSMETMMTTRGEGSVCFFSPFLAVLCVNCAQQSVVVVPSPPCVAWPPTRGVASPRRTYNIISIYLYANFLLFRTGFFGRFERALPLKVQIF